MLKLSDLRESFVAQIKRPRTFVGVVFLAISTAIVVNGLFLQPIPHPAPFFLPREIAAREVAKGDELVRAVQDALTQVGYYGGALDGLAGPKTQAAILAFEAKVGRSRTGGVSSDLLAAIRSMSAPVSTGSVTRPTAAPRATNSNLIPRPAPSRPPGPAALVAAVQNALALSAYGPLTADGVVGPQTRDAIVRFQRDHNLPITGEISDGLVVELRATGAMHDG